MSIQDKRTRTKLSRLRASLNRLAEEVGVLMEPFFSDKPVMKGSVYELKRKCGKPNCKCTEGHLHKRMVLSASEDNKTKLRVIPRGFLVETRKMVRQYQRLRRARARLGQVYREMLRAMDEIEALHRNELG